MALQHDIRFSDALYESRTAHNKAFTFVPADKTWELGIDWKVNLDFIHNAPISNEQKEDLLNLFAFRAQQVSKSKFNKLVWGMTTILAQTEEYLNAESFDVLLDEYCAKSNKAIIKVSIRLFIDAGHEFTSSCFSAFYLNRCQEAKSQPGRPKYNKSHLHPDTGAHTTVEFNSLMEGNRVLTQYLLQQLSQSRPFYCTAKTNANTEIRLLQGGVLWVLLMSILRRPQQLLWIKMDDFRTHTGKFEASFSNDNILMDFDELKLQTFAAKKGHVARGYLDLDLHFLNRQNSHLIVKYSAKLFAEFLLNLKGKGIELTESEKKEIFKRFPLFPAYKLLKASIFESKIDLFNYLSDKTTAGHLSIGVSTWQVSDVIKRFIEPTYFTDRAKKDEGVVTGNNRIRHTILTAMAREGVDIYTLSAITGVTPHAVQHYIDMTPEDRKLIDKTLGRNATLSAWGKVRIQDQIGNNEDIAFNDYGDTFGLFEESSRCGGCREMLPVPLACYGCGNFIAFAQADHQAQHRKASRRYKFNLERGQSEQSLIRLKQCIEYIDITILKCEQYHQQKGLSA
ncbi:TPA: site-specific integrase [Vibrio parahaemolyticus]|nr:site-specific integrase [Vibrio parahaemolyticus]